MTRFEETCLYARFSDLLIKALRYRYLSYGASFDANTRSGFDDIAT